MKVRELKARLADGGELALLDAREQGVHYRGHPFFACSAPLSRLELMVGDLVPRRTVPVVLLDGGSEDLAERAAERMRSLGYTDVSVLEGGCKAWQAEGGELFSGVNVPSKAFGEFVEHHYETPRIPPQRLQEILAGGRKTVILDSRPLEEYRRMAIPGGIDMPGAELAYRVHDLVPDPDTLIVVNCAGRTRSIIGCQSLRNAGIPNEVVALKDGTMGWELAGLSCERGAQRVAPAPSAAGKTKASAAADRVAARFRVRTASVAEVARWRDDASRSFYLLDVRTREEFERSHLAGSRHAPGGQLVQASDEYVGVRNARVVLVDPERVRAVMTASWLNQMGWDDVYVLESAEGWPLESGPRAAPVLGFTAWSTVAEPSGTVLDFSTSLRFNARHIPAAYWVVRSRLSEAKQTVEGGGRLVLTSEDGLLAHLAAAEVAKLWPAASIRVLEGGNAAWFASDRPAEQGMARATTVADDVWYKPYDHAADYEKHAREYLAWEVALVEQIKRDPLIRFRAYDPPA